jgi:hypothetical protein
MVFQLMTLRSTERDRKAFNDTVSIDETQEIGRLFNDVGPSDKVI